MSQKFPGNDGKPLKIRIDPSGYIYEAVPSNRLSGVTVTCYEKVTKLDIYDEPYDEIILWNAAEYDQVNPQLTDNLGQYGWDVPIGWWQVKAELDGYETTYSEWLPVPPPQLDVNLGMVSYAAPEISDLFARTDSVEISFSRYLRTETLTTDNVSVTVGGAEVSGTLELLNAEAEPGNTGKTLASKIRFVPDVALENGVSVVVAISPAVLSYADVAAAQGERAETTVVTIPDELFVAETVGLTYQGSGVVTIQAKPAHLAAGQTVRVSTGSELMLKVAEDTVTLDENGCAVIHITGKLPGETELLFAMSDGHLQAKSRVLVQMPETEETLADVESLEITQDYIALYNGQTAALQSQIQPKKLADKILWSVEAGGETVVAVDAKGNVTALSQGTAYVLATVSDSKKTLTARCRVDVAGALTLDGVRLSADKLTTELYSTDYAQVDILLLLPQNYGAMSLDASGTENLSVAIEKAYFTDEAAAALFDIHLLDDRTAQIVPSSYAIQNPGAVAKRYVSAITVIVDGTPYETEKLTLTVKQSLPKPKVTVDAFNSFYSGQSQQIWLTGVTMTAIGLDSSAKAPLPEWLSLEEDRLYLTEAAPQKNASGKAYLQVWTEEWAIPIAVTANVKNTYKAPGLKLSASSVQVSNQPGSSQGVKLQLLPKNKKETLADLCVKGIIVPAGCQILEYNAADGSFLLKTEDGFSGGKISLTVTFTNTEQTLSIPLTVKTTQVKLKLASTSISLNAQVGDSALVGITATPADYVLSEPVFRLTNNAGADKLASGELEICCENGSVRVTTTDKTPVGENYKLSISAGGSKEVTLKIKTVGGVPSVSLKQGSNLDLSFPENGAVITAAFKNYSGAALGGYDYSIAETKTGVDATALFTLEQENGAFHLLCTEPNAVKEKGAYVLTLKLTLPNGENIESSLKLKVKRTALKLKLSASKLTLNKAVNDTGAVTVTSTTKGYVFTKPVWQLMDKSGKISMDGKLEIRWSDGKLVVGTNANTEYGATYKLLLSAEEGAAATALTVSIPAENKSAVTVTLKLKGNLDVIRDNSEVTATAAYKNCTADAPRTEKLTIVDSGNQDVTGLFDITQTAVGSFTIRKARGAELDQTQKYQVKLEAAFGDVLTESKAAKLTVKMGSAKLTAEAENPVLFAKDKHSRVDFSIASADTALNAVARVELKDAKYQNVFELFDYGSGRFAIGIREGADPGTKPVTLTLNVFLEGNTSAKANAALKLKISMIP